jgi:hypothetical protein
METTAFINEKFGALLDSKLLLMKLMAEGKMEYDERALEILNNRIKVVKGMYPKENNE